MIQAVTIDGVQVNDDCTFLTNVSDSSAAQTELRTYARGGRSGVALGNPFYRGFVLSMEWIVACRSYSQLVAKRDRLAKFFRIKPDKTASQTRTLGFIMADGSHRTVPAIFTPYTGGIAASDVTKTTILVTANTELEYMISSNEMTQVINPYKLGGFSIPFDVPFNMNVSETDPYSQTGAAVTINNQGNAEYYPIITFNGDLNVFALYNDTIGKNIGYNGELLEGDTLVLDTYERTAVKNGTTNALADISGSSDWLWLEPGNNVLRLVSAGGSGTAVVTYHHAYRGL